MLLAERLDKPMNAEDVVAYIVAVAAHRAYTTRFADDLHARAADPAHRRPGPLGSGRGSRPTSYLAHTYGERAVDASAGRPAGTPRISGATTPVFPMSGAVPSSADGFPDTITFDAGTKRLSIGKGYIEMSRPKLGV